MIPKHLEKSNDDSILFETSLHFKWEMYSKWKSWFMTFIIFEFFLFFRFTLIFLSFSHSLSSFPSMSLLSSWFILFLQHWDSCNAYFLTSFLKSSRFFFLPTVRVFFFLPIVRVSFFMVIRTREKSRLVIITFPLLLSILFTAWFFSLLFLTPSVLSIPHLLNGIGWCNRQKERDRPMFSQEKERDSREQWGRSLAVKEKNRRKVNQLEIEMQHIPSGNWKKHERWRKIERKTSYQ